MKTKWRFDNKDLHANTWGCYGIVIDGYVSTEIVDYWVISWGGGYFGLFRVRSE